MSPRKDPQVIPAEQRRHDGTPRESDNGQTPDRKLLSAVRKMWRQQVRPKEIRRALAEKFDVTERTVSNYITRIRAEYEPATVKERAEEVEQHRADLLAGAERIRRLIAKAVDPEVITKLTKEHRGYMTDIAKLRGLNAPEKHDTSVTVNQDDQALLEALKLTPEQRRKRIAELEAERGSG